MFYLYNNICLHHQQSLTNVLPLILPTSLRHRFHKEMERKQLESETEMIRLEVSKEAGKEGTRGPKEGKEKEVRNVGINQYHNQYYYNQYYI